MSINLNQAREFHPVDLYFNARETSIHRKILDCISQLISDLNLDLTQEVYSRYGDLLIDLAIARGLISHNREAFTQLLTLLVDPIFDLNKPLSFPAESSLNQEQKTLCHQLNITAHRYFEFYDALKKVSKNNVTSWNRSTLLHAICTIGNSDALRILLTKTNLDVNVQNEAGYTPLMLACANGHLELVEELLAAQGININQAKQGYITPFMFACYLGKVKVVEVLLKDPRIVINQPDPQGWTFFMIHNINRNSRLVEVLLNDPRIAIDLSVEGRQALFRVACANGHFGVVKQLLAVEGINVNQAMQCRWTPLMVACLYGHLAVVKELLKVKEIDVNQAGQGGETPLMGACKNGHLEVVKELLKVKEIDVNQAAQGGSTPFMVACLYGRLEVVKELLKVKGIDANQARQDGCTPFVGACQNGQVEIVKQLLSHDSLKTKLTDINYKKAFERAIKIPYLNRGQEMVRLLVENIPTCVNTLFSNEQFGYSLFTAVCKAKKADIAQYLLGTGFRSILEAFLVCDWFREIDNSEFKYSLLKNLIESSISVIRKDLALFDKKELFAYKNGIFKAMLQDDRAYQIVVGAGLKGEFYLKMGAKYLLKTKDRKKVNIQNKLIELRRDALLHARPMMRQEHANFLFTLGIGLSDNYFKVKDISQIKENGISKQDKEDMKQSARFLTILKRVPDDVKWILACRAINSRKDFILIPEKQKESVRKELFQPYLPQSE
jgi:ankyrin repeat protein